MNAKPSIIAYVQKMHEGQLDKAGEDYFTAHLVPVAMSVPKHLVHVALGHDLLEDTEANFKDMLEAGFTHDEFLMITYLTKTPNMSLEYYIAHVRIYNDTIIVKIADVINNVSRLHKLDEATQARLVTKYNKTLRLLNGIEE